MARKKHNKHIGTCHICYTHIKTIVSPCECSICPSCWSQMILTKVQETNSVHETITCPRETCKKQLSITSLSSKLPRHARDEIDQANLKVYLSKASDIRQCPSKKCNYAGVIDTKTSCSEKLRCKACGTTWRDKVHYTSFEKIQYSLSQVIKQKNEVFSELWKKMRTKKCPSCKVSIDKNGGCDHMVCSKCNYQFCWACLQTSNSPGHDLSRHNYEAYTKPRISGFLMLLAFLFMLYALYLLPPVNFVIHATVVPATQWGWRSLILPIFNAISTIFGPPVRWCWPYIKAFVKWAGYNIFTGILLNLIFHQTWVLMMKLTKNHCPARMNKKGSVGIIIICIGLTYYTQVYEQMLKVGILEAGILLCMYIKYRVNLLRRPVIQRKCY